MWVPNLESIEEKNLNIHKIVVKKEMSMVEFESKVKEVLGVPQSSKLAITRRHNDYGVEYTEIMNDPIKGVKSVEDYNLPENQLLHVEEMVLGEDGKVRSKWADEFEID